MMDFEKKRIVFSLSFGIFLLIIGIVILFTRPQDIIVDHLLQGTIPLRNGTAGYKNWKHSVLELKIYLFHVTNPKEIQKNGESPILIQYGPYVYDEYLERTILRINESADTIDYVAKRTLIFNPIKSGNYSENDEITILNAAYLGTMLTIAGKFAPFLSVIGNNIPLLFPDSKSIFVHGKVKDILFDGLPLICDSETYPQLGMICNVIKSNRPPIVREIFNNGTYAYSFFYKMNGTNDGPYKIFRGIKDREKIGYILEFKGSHYADYWSEKNCSIVKGGDSVFYSPMNNRLPKILTFASDLCRWVEITYKKDEIYNGLLGYHYSSSKNYWQNLNSSCYCPRALNGTIKCPPFGLLDLEKCQKAPVLSSEPHFLYGASDLLSKIQGLNPDEKKHSSYVVVEPFTGAPLSGYRKMQLNMILQPLPVNLLVNVSIVVFPIVWVEEGLTPSIKLLEPIILIHRINRLLQFISWLPFVIGIIWVIYLFFIIFKKWQ